MLKNAYFLAKIK